MNSNLIHCFSFILTCFNNIERTLFYVRFGIDKNKILPIKEPLKPLKINEVSYALLKRTISNSVVQKTNLLECKNVKTIFVFYFEKNFNLVQFLYTLKCCFS